MWACTVKVCRVAAPAEMLMLVFQPVEVGTSSFHAKPPGRLAYSLGLLGVDAISVRNNERETLKTFLFNFTF